MKPQTIVFVSEKHDFEIQRHMLHSYDTIVLSAAQQFMHNLIDFHPAMIFIDAMHEDWRVLSLTCKSNAATRRIPLCLVSDDSDIRADAIMTGADRALSWAELNADVGAIVAELARAPDQAILEQLECECKKALPPEAVQGVEQFNRGEYYLQHDLFEAQWMESSGPVRDLYRAILQVGVAYYQIERGNYRGALKMFQRSVQWLYLLPDTCQGIDVAQLRRDSYAVRAELHRLGPDRLGDLDRRLLKKLRWNPPQAPKT